MISIKTVEDLKKEKINGILLPQNYHTLEFSK
jgi:hypothetical protein